MGFFIIFNSNWNKDEQKLHYAIMIKCSMGADGGHERCVNVRCNDNGTGTVVYGCNEAGIIDAVLVSSGKDLDLRAQESLAKLEAGDLAAKRGMDRRSLAFAAEVSSCAMTLSIRCSRSLTCVSSRVRRSASMPSTSAGMSCFLRAAIWAKSRLRMSTICALRVVNALRIRKFSVGSRRPASGRNSMNRAISSASIRSVFARVPRERAKALICAGGNWPASISAATSVAQSTHS